MVSDITLRPEPAQGDVDLEERTVGVGAEAEFAGWLVVIDDVSDRVLLGGVPDVVSSIPCFSGRAVTSPQQSLYEVGYSGRRSRCFS